MVEKNTVCRLSVIALLFLLVSSNCLFASEKSLKIAMILWRGETRAENGLVDGLKELGYSADYAIFNADQDITKLGVLLSKLTPELADFDYIYTFGTTVSRRTQVVVGERVPQVFNVVTDPVGAGIVKTLESSGGNISGVSDVVPVSVQIKSALGVLKINKLGIFFNPREKNSMITRKEIYDIAEYHDFRVIDLRSPPEQKMLQENLQKLIDESIHVDTVYLPPDSYLVSNAKLIGAQLKAAKIPSIGSVKEFIEHGVLMGVVVDYYQLGRAAATIIDRHQKGENLQDIPVGQAEESNIVINKTTSELLDIKIPETISKQAIVFE